MRLREHDKYWLIIFGFCLAFSWVGAMLAWLFADFATISPIKFGLYFSALSFVGCGIGWLVSLRRFNEN